jgi:hypothetical protein
MSVRLDLEHGPQFQASKHQEFQYMIAGDTDVFDESCFSEQFSPRRSPASRPYVEKEPWRLDRLVFDDRR